MNFGRTLGKKKFLKNFQNRMQKVLITGGSGFIGFHLAKELSKTFKVDILDNFSRGVFDKDLINLIKNQKVKLIRFDMKKKINLKGKNYIYIFHLPATIGVNNVINNPWEVLKLNNFLTTKNIIEFRFINKNHIENFLENCIY